MAAASTPGPWAVGPYWNSPQDFLRCRRVRALGGSWHLAMTVRSRSSAARWKGGTVAGWTWASAAPAEVTTADGTFRADEHYALVRSRQESALAERPPYFASFFVGVFQIDDGDPRQPDPWDGLSLLTLTSGSFRAAVSALLHSSKVPEDDGRWIELLLSANASLMESAAQNRIKRDRLSMRKSDARREVFNRLLVAMDYVHSNLADELTLDSICGIAGFSRAHFCRTFREAFGMSPGEYVSSLRFGRAVRLLESSDLPIARILSKVGWSSAPSFCRAFRERYGAAPTDRRSANLSRSDNPCAWVAE